MTIGIDFDGCLVSWNFPLVGKDIGSAEVCRDLVKKGVNMLIFGIEANSVPILIIKIIYSRYRREVFRSLDMVS